jgi:ABC-type multidrug transport system ATPase subunit
MPLFLQVFNFLKQSSLCYFDINIVNQKVCFLAAHSMEEAEVLCDRVGIFVDGGFRCIANPKEVYYHIHLYKAHTNKF